MAGFIFKVNERNQFVLSSVACSGLRDSWAAKLRKREDESKTGGNLGENFSRAFYFRVFPTIWEPGTGYVKCIIEDEDLLRKDNDSVTLF